MAIRKDQKKSYLSSTLITIFIVIMLIISGPAQAVRVTISGLQTTPYTQGSFVNFTVSIEISDPDAFVPMSNISVNVTGPSNINRTFALDGTPMSGDSIINITPVSTPRPGDFGYGYGYGYDSGLGGYNFGYGYGYGNGTTFPTYIYNVTITTTSLPIGNYTAITKLNTNRSIKPSFESGPAYFDIAADTTPPVISSVTLNNTAPNTGDSILVTVDVTDDVGVTSVTANGTALAFGSGTTWTGIITAEEGTHIVTVIATDASANTATDESASYIATTAPDTTPPVISSVTLNTTTPLVGQAVLVTVDVTDDTAVTGVQANDVSLVAQGGNIWNGTIIAEAGTHSVNVSASDAAGNVAWNNATTYAATTRVVPLPIDSNGTTTTTVTATSPSGNVTVTIPIGTHATDINGNPLTSISINSTASLPPNASVALSANDRVVGEIVNLGPEGATFNPPIQIRFNYTEAMLTAAGISASELRVKFYNTVTNTWEVQTPYTLYETGKYIIANVSHFSTFALIGTVTTTPPPSGGGGGGGGSGGGGVTTSEPSENIAKAETIVKSLIANRTISYTFTAPEHGIYELGVTDKENENDIAIRVEALKGTSKLVTASAPGIAYKNVNIWAGTKKIKEALIRFKVNNSWISSNNLATSDVKMVKWDGSKWVQLETAEKTKDDTFTYYDAKTDTLSVFAIAGLKGVVVPTATPAIEVTETPAMPAVTATTPAPAPTKKVSGFELLLGIAALHAIYLFSRKRR